MGCVQFLFPPISSRTVEKAPQKREDTRWQYKIFMAYRQLTIITTRGDRKFEHYRIVNADTKLQAGRIGTSQCSTYEFQLSGHVTIGAGDCDNKCHASSSQYIVIDNKKTKNYQEKVLLSDLWEKFQSWK